MNGLRGRFQVRDLLLGTTAFSIYLTGLVYTLKVQKVTPTPWMILENIVGVLFSTTVFLAVMRVLRRAKLRNAGPFSISFQTDFPWRQVFHYVLFLFGFGFLLNWSRAVYYGASIPILGFQIQAILDSTVLIGKKGVFYQFWLIPWSTVSCSSSEHDKLHINLGIKWLWHKIEVPQVYQEQVRELIAEANWSTSN